MQEETAANDNLLGRKYPFDFILGSMHCVNRRDLYEEKTYAGKTKQEAVRGVSCWRRLQTLSCMIILTALPI